MFARSHGRWRILRWVALVMCLATIVLFASSWRWRLGLGYSDRPGGAGWGVAVGGGQLVFVVGMATMHGHGWECHEIRPADRAIRWRPYSRRFPSRAVWEAGVPIWIPILVLAALSVWAWQREMQPAPRRCTTCTYDLTGNTSGVCPECGTEVERT